MTAAKQNTRRSPLSLRLGALSTVALVVLVGLMYAAFIWRACEVTALAEFFSAFPAFPAFHTRAGC